MTGAQAASGPTLRELLGASTLRLIAASGHAGGRAEDVATAASDARREAEMLIGQVLGRERAWCYAHADERLALPAVAQFEQLLARRLSGEPLAYILGRREFWSLDLTVTPDVLIPRAETELLVELALQHIPQGEHVEIVDAGTGSGAIALALARERPQARVLAIDSSEAALDVASANARRLDIANVEFALSDWFAAIGERRFHLIVANPPYIAEADAHLAAGDLRFEPRAALASGVHGLDAIRCIVCATPAHLAAGGWLLFEHGHEQGEAARALLRENGFVEIFTRRDLEKRERVSGGRVPN